MVIPAYNAADWLPYAIESVLVQTRPPCELIVADDGSTDNTAEVVARYGHAVRHVVFRHGGVYAVRNAILPALKGTWFLNLDADNGIEPDFLEKALEIVETHADDASFAFVYPDMQCFGERTDVVERPDFSVTKLKEGNYLDMNSLVRTDVARRFGFDPAFNSGQGDYDFFLTLVENGFRGTPLRSSRLHYRVHPGSISYEGRRRFQHRRLADQILAKHTTFFTKREAAKLRDRARRGCANAMWGAVYDEYEIGRYRAALRYAHGAMRCDIRMLSRGRIALLIMSLAVHASGGILWMSRPLEVGETLAYAPSRIWHSAYRKLRYWWWNFCLRLKYGELPVIWVKIRGTVPGRTTPRIRTRRSVEMQDYRRWHWLEKGSSPAGHDYVMELAPGDELYPNALFMLVREGVRRQQPDVIFSDHAWSNGERSRQPCFKPDLPVSELRWNADVLDGTMMVRGDVWRTGGGIPRGACRLATSVAHTRAVLMNRIVPFATADRHAGETRDDGPRVGIVIPTRDRVKLLGNAIRSIREHTAYTNYEIVVVDNGSTETGTVEYLRQCGEKVVRCPGPFNYAALNNAGTRALATPLVLFLNDDIEVPSCETEWLSWMVATVSEPGVGVVGARLDYPCGATQHGGIGIFRGAGGKLLMRNLFSGQVDRNFWVTRRRECLAVTGACQMVRREAFESVNGYDEQFPVVCNDVDFCLRVREAGWRVIYQPAARLVHHEGVSSAGCKARAKEIDNSHKLFDSRWSDKIKRDSFARLEWEGLK